MFLISEYCSYIVWRYGADSGTDFRFCFMLSFGKLQPFTNFDGSLLCNAISINVFVNTGQTWGYNKAKKMLEKQAIHFLLLPTLSYWFNTIFRQSRLLSPTRGEQRERSRSRHSHSPTPAIADTASTPSTAVNHRNMPSANSKSGVLAQQIHDEFLTCKICLEGFTNPKSLDCLHTFCEDCIESHANSEGSYKKYSDYREFTCPLCRKRTTLPLGGVKKLPDNFLVSSLTEVIDRQKPSKFQICDFCKLVNRKHKEATAKCLDCCKLLCKACIAQHNETKVSTLCNCYRVTSCRSTQNITNLLQLVTKVHSAKIRINIQGMIEKSFCFYSI